MGQSQHVILSGCSGGGKSALIDELGRQGFTTVEEPGRRIVAEQLRKNGHALPWLDLGAFARQAIKLAERDRENVQNAQGWVFFDRSLIDAAVALEQATGCDAADILSGKPRYYRRVFLTPPWPEIFRTDAERRHGFEEAQGEYVRLRLTYEKLGYEQIILPKTNIGTRADFVLRHLC